MPSPAAPTLAPYGSWKSPILAADVAAGTLRLGEVLLEGPDVYWVELRPSEAGRCVIVHRFPDSHTEDVNPAPLNARTRVHEYGGGSYLPVGPAVYFANYADQRLYRAERGAPPQPITPEGPCRYADFVWDASRSRLVSIREDHTQPENVVNTIVAVDAEGRRPNVVLVSGSDFFAAPRISPDGSRLAWLSWNHPDMPWDSTVLWVAPIAADGTLGQPQRVAGSPEESVSQPEWSPDGVLYFASDRTDWWNLYRWRNGRVETVTQLEAELAAPEWVFRQSNYGFDDEGGRLLCAYFQEGRSSLAFVDAATCKLTPIQTPYDSLGSVRVGDGLAVFLGASPTKPAAVVCLNLATGHCQELRRSSPIEYDPGYISSPLPVDFPTTGGQISHGLFYQPQNKDFAAPGGEKPPLVVMVHGGPTSATTTAFRPGIQYYTSRGVAVLDVNYGGSSGYGRKYRQRLNDNWGIVDVDDCCNGAAHLASQGLVNGARMAITGGSAGGYTVLAALTMRKTFAAGASHFGVSDCEALAKETHKFESRYLDRLIGPYPARRDLYLERSPIQHVDGLSCPVIFFQGLEDKIVPPNQARMMADALRKKGLPVALLEFEGEQHGFRQAKNIRRAMEAELYFFARVFGFTPADKIEPVAIENI